MIPAQAPPRGSWASYDPDAAAPPRLTAPELIAMVVEQNDTRDGAALVSVVLENLPRDFGGLRLAVQELVAYEIQRRLQERAAAPSRAAATAPEFVEWGAPSRDRKQAPRSRKWEATAKAVNDPLAALVFVAGGWLPWGSLESRHLRALARRADEQASALLARSITLDKLATDMDAAGIGRLAALPGAADRIAGL